MPSPEELFHELEIVGPGGPGAERAIKLLLDHIISHALGLLPIDVGLGENSRVHYCQERMIPGLGIGPSHLIDLVAVVLPAGRKAEHRPPLVLGQDWAESVPGHGVLVAILT